MRDVRTIDFFGGWHTILNITFYTCVLAGGCAMHHYDPGSINSFQQSQPGPQDPVPEKVPEKMSQEPTVPPAPSQAPDMGQNQQPAPPKQNKPIDYGPQIVFVVDQTLENGSKIVVPKAVAGLRLDPVYGPTVKAPMKKGDLLLCRDFQAKTQDGLLVIAWRCGENVYVTRSVGFAPEGDKHRHAPGTDKP